MIEAIWMDTEKLDAYERDHKLSLAGLGQLITNIGDACKRDDYEYLKQFDFVVLTDPYTDIAVEVKPGVIVPGRRV